MTFSAMDNLTCPFPKLFLFLLSFKSFLRSTAILSHFDMATGGRRTGRKRKKKHHSHHHHQHHHHYHHQDDHLHNQHLDLSTLISAVAGAAAAAHNFLSENDLQLLPSQTLALESKLTSTALSLSKLHSLLHPLNPNPQTLEFPSLPSPSSSSSSSSSAYPCWFHRFLSFASNDSDAKWVEAFRMSKPSFDLLLENLAPNLQNSGSNLPANFVLGAALFRLAHGASYKAVGRRFGTDSAAACRCFYEVSKAVNERLVDLLEVPSDLNRVFVGLGGGSLPNCCGILGFSRFLIDGGGVAGEDKAVIVQGLVDLQGRFMDVSAGWPGSMEPGSILRQSKLFTRVEEAKELLNGCASFDVNGNLIPQYVLGDACCPLLPWLLTPFPVSCTDFDSNSAEQAFNSIHSQGMGLVRAAFGRVRSQWRLLSMKWKKECLEFLPFVVVTSCLLHNFLIKCNEVLSDEYEDDFKYWGFPAFRGEGNEKGEMIRDALASQLGLVSQNN